MVKVIEHGFKIMPRIDGVNSFLFDSGRPEQSVNFIRNNGFTRVMLNPFHGFTSNELESILPLNDFIEELIIGSEKIGYKGLDSFHKLTLLGVPDNGKDVVDLNNFPNLRILNCGITARLMGLENCKKLMKLTISDYKSKNKSLEGLPTLHTLEYLSLIKPDITTLQGIMHFSNLKTLEIFSASKLETLAPLESLSSLIVIQIEKCKKVCDFEILEKIHSLEKIILSESGEMKSLSFIKELPGLKRISFWGTNVLDGDIKYCEGINFVGFDNKRHYTHKSEQFKKFDSEGR